MLNLREMPEAQNNIDRWGNGGGYFSVVTKGKKNDDISESVVNVLTRIVAIIYSKKMTMENARSAPNYALNH